MNSLYPSIAFVVVGIAICKVVSTFFKTKQDFINSVVKVKDLQDQLAISINQLQEAHKEVIQLKSDLSALSFKVGMKLGK